MKRDLLVPLEPINPYGTKGITLEQEYYEQFNRSNMHVVDVKADPIVKLTSRGIVTKSGNLYEVEVIAMATGYDSLVGGLFDLKIRDTNGLSLVERWKNGVSSVLGMLVPEFPNMCICYGAQTPPAIGRSPMFIEWQADWIRDMIRRVEERLTSNT